MSHKWKKNNYIALFVSIALHALVVLLLFFIVLHRMEAEEMGGVLVNIGEVDVATGTFRPEPIVPAPQSSPLPTTTPPTQTSTEQLLTQEDQEAPTVVPPKQKVKSKKTPPKPQINTQDLRRAEEAKKAEEARRRVAAEEQRRRDAISRSVSGAFGNTGGSGSGDAEIGGGQQGSPDGNVKGGGINTGVGGFGSYNLAGRGLRGSGLPRPAYTKQTEGRIVVRIIVDITGKVISANIAPGTNIEDYSMRQSALKAARQALFTPLKEGNNQTGTITYTYKLK